MAYIKSFGTTFAIGDGNLASTPTYTNIGQLDELDPGEFSNVMADVTHLSSTNGAVEQIASGLREAIEISGVIHFDPDLATHTNSSGGMYYAWANKTELAWRITLTDTTNTVYTFDGYVMQFKINVGDGSEALSADFTIAVTGDITVA